MGLRINTDLVAGIVGVVFFAVFWFNRGTQSPLSSVFPDAVLSVTLVVSVALLVKGFVKGDVRRGLDDRNLVPVGIMIAALFIWWLGIRYVGFVVTSSVMFFAISLYLARYVRDVRWRQILICAVVALGVVGLFYLVFSQVLHIRPFRTPLI